MEWKPMYPGQCNHLNVSGMMGEPEVTKTVTATPEVASIL